MSDERLSYARSLALKVTLAALCCAPFLQPVHVMPIPSFYSEWLAAVISLILIGVSFAPFILKVNAVELPAATATITLVLVAVVVQHILGIGHFSQQTLLYSAYLILALTMMLAGRKIATDMGLPGLSIAMATGFTFGALSQCCVAFIQIQGLSVPLFVTPLLQGSGAYGNIAQQNHLTHYLWLGILSLIYLRLERRVSLIPFMIAFSAMAIASAYTTSRSAVLYPLAILVINHWSARSLVAPCSVRRARNVVTKACLVALLALALPQLAPISIEGNERNSVMRLVSSAVEPSGAGIRLQLAGTAARAAFSAPWFGHGVGSVPLQSLINGPTGPTRAFGVAEHFHNVIANCAVEFGLAVTLLLFVLLTRWTVRVCRSHWSLERQWALGILLIAALHSLLEYPLWYSFFLAPVALLLGALDTRHFEVKVSRLSVAAMGVGSIFVGLVMFNLWQDHGRLATIYLTPRSGPQAEAVWHEQVGTLQQLHNDSLFSPLINGMLIVTAEIDRRNLTNKLQVCDDALHYSPTPRIIFKCAALLHLAGRSADGLTLAKLGIQAFPGDVAGVANDLAAVGFVHELAPLLDLIARSQLSATAVSDR